MWSLAFLLGVLSGPLLEDPLFSQEIQQRAFEATARMYYRPIRGEGTAVIVWKQGDKVILLTAAHNVPEKPGSDEAVELSFYTVKNYPKLKQEAMARVMARMPNEDLAVLAAIIPNAPEPLPICPPDQRRPGSRFPVLTVGCVADGPPQIQRDQTTDVKFIKKPDNSGANFWETRIAQAVGRSGGPLMDTRGFLLGVCSGIQQGKGYYLHLNELHRALSQAGFRYLYEGEKKP